MADPLEAAYYFLRRVEHLLQYREDEQTHLLPRDPQLRTDLAIAMGMEPTAFETQLATHRALVTNTFRDAFRLAGVGGDEDHAAASAPAPGSSAANLSEHITQQLGEQADTINRQVETLLDSHRIRSLPATSRKRLKALLPAIINTAVTTGQPATTATRLLTLVEHIAQRSAYLALLAEYPETLARVARIVAASPWAAQYLNQYPLLLDSLIEWRSLMQTPDFHNIADQLHSDLDACQLPNGLPDIEQQMNLMRDTQHQITFQLLAQDLEGQLTVEALADHLSALADMLLQATIDRVWPLVQPRNKTNAIPTNTITTAQDATVAELAPPRFAIIAYGKLGGKEIGYASDLDLVFIYDDEREDAGELYAKLGRRVTSWLSTMTSSGRLYEVDLRLRPDGDAGLLAASLEAFTHYQLNQAWPWEHQALTRARVVAGHPHIAQHFDALRERILLLPRDPEQLKQDVRSMRDKITAGHPNRSPDFDLKHDRGGMVDVEFVTQYLVLSQACQHPVLLGNLGNIALLQLAAKAGLLPTELASNAADAYRSLRRRQHALRLQGAERARVPSDELAQERDVVRRLWKEVIG